MKYLTKKRIKSIISVLQKSLKTVKLITDSNDLTNKNILTDILIKIQDMAVQAGNFIETDNGTEDIIRCLEKFCEEIYCIYIEAENEKKYKEHLKTAEQLLLKILHDCAKSKTDYKVVFLPYKSSMWDSMESIYFTVKKQTNCICQIVPIPYFNKNENNEKIELVCEEKCFEDKYDILNYREYDMVQEDPDVIFIHNPYDDCNKVTEIKEEYFSSNLKRTGAVLIYVPYYTAGYCEKLENMAGCRTPGVLNADYIILQSENLKKAFMFWGIEENRLLVTGSPKIDYVRNVIIREKPYFKEWSDILRGRTVFLLNSSIHTFLNNKNWIDQIEIVIQTVLDRGECGLIWRPHPLLRNTIVSMKPDAKDKFDALIYKAQNSEGVLLDYGENYKNAFVYSDAMISDYSSLALLYTYTEKPVYFLKGNERNREKIVFCDYFSNYFKEDGISLEQFIENICNNADPKKEERMAYAYASIVNSDGTCGEKTWMTILKKMENELYAGDSN